MAKSLGKQRYLYEALDDKGNSIIAIWCERTIYERKDGTLYVRIDGRNYDLTRKADGTFYMPT
jgi:hypothetical protein